jgi:hypothetical protein
MEKWQEIARSFDTYDIEDTGYAFNAWRDMVKQAPSGPHSHFGDYVLTEDACKRIAELERNQRGLSEFAKEIMDWWAQQPASEAHATPPLGLFTMVEGLRQRIAELEPYRLACRKIQQWIGCEDQEVDEAVVRRVEGDARKIVEMEAELESINRVLGDTDHEQCCNKVTRIDRIKRENAELEARLRTMRDAFAIIRDIADSPQVVEIARRFAEEVSDG